MTTPSLCNVFLVKEQADQHWTSNGNRYNVFRLYDWLKGMGMRPIPVDVDMLRKGYEKTNVDEPKGSDEFWERAEAAGDDPILVVYDEDDDWWIADGNHRFARKLRDGEDTIMAYVAFEGDLPEEAIEPKR